MQEEKWEELNAALKVLGGKLEEHDKILSKLWQASRGNRNQLDYLAIAFLIFTGVLLIFAFGIRVQTDQFSYGLDSNVLVRIVEISSAGAGAGVGISALAKRLIGRDEEDRERDEDKGEDGE